MRWWWGGCQRGLCLRLERRVWIGTVYHKIYTLQRSRIYCWKLAGQLVAHLGDSGQACEESSASATRRLGRLPSRVFKRHPQQSIDEPCSTNAWLRHAKLPRSVCSELKVRQARMRLGLHCTPHAARTVVASRKARIHSKSSRRQRPHHLTGVAEI